MHYLTLTEFNEWKSNYERATVAWFVQSSGTKTYNGSKVTYFYCNRSGYFRSESTGKRALKTQGSSKIDGHCTAGIQLSINRDGKVKAKVTHAHYGHDSSLGHLRLPEYARLEIAHQLNNGVSMTKLLDKIRDSLIGNHVERVHLLTKKDLYNIENSFQLRVDKRHQDDAMSVRLLVEELTSGDENPVLLYKPQGSFEPIVGTAEGLGYDDFLLVLQSSFQAEVLYKCVNSNVVCVDATHGTNSYDFQLISLLVVDEVGEGFPAAWCLSNKEDQVAITNFFSAIKQNTGALKPQWFMSDDADQYFNSWVQVFSSESCNKLLCAWHVDRAWRKGGLPKIRGQELQVDVYHTLRVLLDETDKDKFESLLTKALIQWQSDELMDFREYFNSNYVPRKKEWATCYRINARVNTNMYAEAFHRVLKHIYMKGTVNKRVDTCITTLLRFSRDKMFDRLLKIEKGKNSHRLQTINDRHAVSLAIPLSHVQPEADSCNTWSVKSSSSSKQYMVSQVNGVCPNQCLLKCRVCAICIHQYTCSCFDSALHGTICKHIHLVRRYNNQCKNTPQPLLLKGQVNGLHLPDGMNATTHTFISQFSQTNIQERVSAKLTAISSFIDKSEHNTEALLSIERQLNPLTGRYVWSK